MKDSQKSACPYFILNYKVLRYILYWMMCSSLAITLQLFRGRIWATDQTLCDINYCWNKELFNTSFNENILLTAVLRMILYICESGIIPQTIIVPSKLGHP